MASEILIDTSDGEARAFLYQTEQPNDTSVIVFMDVFGIRPALFDICERIFMLGYNVLLPDLYYRLGEYGPFKASDIIGVPEKFAAVRELRDKTPVAATMADVPHFIHALTSRGIGGDLAFVGYCMGGGRAIRAANTAPERVKAVASIHGGRLAVDDPESPHLHLDRLKARLYIGCAGEDESFPPEQSGLLVRTLRESQIDHLIENYRGCQHGWALPDNPIFNHRGSERHWQRLETFLRETLR